MSNKRRANGAAPPAVLLQVTVIGRPGSDGAVAINTQYSREHTVRLIRDIADRYERAGQAPPAPANTTDGEDTPE